MIMKTVFNNEVLRFDSINTSLDDDVIINYNLSCLVKQTMFEKSSQDIELFEFELNMHVLFVKLLASISFDHQILLDWLITNETNFLVYLVKYLKSLNHELSSGRKKLLKLFSKTNENRLKSFDESLAGKNHGDISIGEFYLRKSFKTLIDLTKKIKKVKRSFPYNCSPLIKLLDSFVELTNQIE